MNRTIIISEDLYRELENIMQRRGLTSVEQLLYELLQRETDLEQRRETVDKIDNLRCCLVN